MNDELYQDKYRIASARWPGHDYSQGGSYFVTICTKDRYPYFGEIVPATTVLQNACLVGNALSSRAYECWLRIPQHFPFVEAGPFVVMPDHVHGILTFHRAPEHSDQTVSAFGPQSNNLASVVRGFKTGIKAWATAMQVAFAWQPRYYDRVVRNETELDKITRYILDNPNRWESDRGNELGVFC